MKHRFSHGSDPETVARAAKQAFSHYAALYPRYQLGLDWKNDASAVFNIEIKGMRVRGDLDIGASDVEVDLALPFLFRPFARRATDIVEREARAWIAKATTG